MSHTKTQRPRVATLWLDGCSGCHMSFLDIDERLLELSEKIELVYSPLIDCKIYPEQVDIVLVEGAVGTEEDLHLLQLVRERSRIVVAFGDCAIHANVPGMRNSFTLSEITTAGYGESLPTRDLPKLLPHSRPLSHYIHIDHFLGGCPPEADQIYAALTALIAQEDTQ